jgi:inositol transport system permease protein
MLNRKATKELSKYGIYISFIVLVAVMSLVSPYFLRIKNITNILNQVSIIGIISIGSTLVLLAGGIDLSPGAVVAVAGVAAASFGHPGEYPIFVPILVSLAVGSLFGLVAGAITAKGGVPPFIVTLGLMSVGKGIAMLACGGMQVINLSAPYKHLASNPVFGVPILILIYLGIFLVVNFFLNNTRFGRHVYAIGGNETAAIVSGLNVDRVKILVYTIAGALSGLGGLLLSSRTVVGSPIAGDGYELDAIAAAVIGGTSTTGGVGRLAGTIVGALIIQVISNGLDMVNVPSYYQQIVKGTIIVFAVYVDIRSKKKG